MNKVTDVGLLALAGAGVGPGLHHLEFRGVSPDFQLNFGCFLRVVFIVPLFCIDHCVEFRFFLLVSKVVSCYFRGEVSQKVYVLCYLCASVLSQRLGNVTG